MTPIKKREHITSYTTRHPCTPRAWLMEAVHLSKQGWHHTRKEKQDTTALKEKIEAVLIESPYYGYKRVTKELYAQGENHNHKKIYKIMGEYHLLQSRKAKRPPHTTNSRHTLLVYANEVQFLGKVLPSWVWVSDVTYVWIGTGWAYLALIMDQGSRKIVGWHMSLSLHRSLCIEALTRALARHGAPRYHHSDRGVQYCSYDYIQILKDHSITPSMASVGMSVDNPYAESLNRSIKVEEVYLHAYESFAEARESIAKYIEVYNTRRLHSSLGYISPAQFETNYQLTLLKDDGGGVSC